MAPVVPRHHGRPRPFRLPCAAVIAAIRGGISFDTASRSADFAAFAENMADLVQAGADPSHFEPFPPLPPEPRPPSVFQWRRPAAPGFSPIAMRPPVHLAAGFDNLPGLGPEGIRVLVELGADPDGLDAMGIPPLVLCAIRNDLPSFEELLELGADPLHPAPSPPPGDHPLGSSLAGLVLSRLSPQGRPPPDTASLCLAASLLLHGPSSPLADPVRSVLARAELLALGTSPLPPGPARSV